MQSGSNRTAALSGDFANLFHVEFFEVMQHDDFSIGTVEHSNCLSHLLISFGKLQVLIRCTQSNLVASHAFAMDHVVEAKIIEEGLLIRTRDPNAFFKALNRIILDNEIEIETVMPADESVHAVYDYLIGNEGASS